MVELWLNNTSVTSSDLWYGVSFSGSSINGTRTGNQYMHTNKPIQSLMKGCTITADGTIKYLKPNDWTKYEDGTSRDNTLNTMVEIPEYSIYFTLSAASSCEVRISPYRLPGYVTMKKCYIGAYEAYNSGGVLKSVKGYVPTVNTTRANFLTYARANGSIHWNMYTYQAHKQMTWLFVVEFATRQCQSTTTLGSGITSGTNNGAYSFVPTGHTDSLGNGSGQVKWEGAITVYVPRYRGIENPWGHVWKNVIDVIVTGTDNKVYINFDYSTFSNSISDCELQTFKDNTGNGYVVVPTGNVAGDLFPANVAGSASTYYGDYHYTNPVATDRTLLIGGGSGLGAGAGLFYLSSSNGLGYSYANVGSRLTYLI